MKKINTIVLILLFIAGLYYSIFSEHGFIERLKLQKNIELLNTQITAKELEIAKIKETINQLKSDNLYIEKIARENYKMIKPDEIIIKIEDK